MNIKKVLVTLNIASLLGTLVWLMIEHSWEPLVTSIGLIGSLIALIFSNTSNKPGIEMSQKGGKKSNNYQSGGDINITK
jgi:hypothetical protein